MIRITICILLIVFFSISSYSQKENNKLHNKSETKHFIFYFEEDSVKLIDVFNVLEKSYERISIAFNVKMTNKVKIEIYPSITEYHQRVYGKKVEEWKVGFFDLEDTTIRMVSPNNPGNAHDYNEIIGVSVHEFVHYVTPNLLKLPVWLREGLAMYYAEQLNDKEIDFLKTLIENNKIPKLSHLNNRNFVKKNGYVFSYTIVEFIIKNYGTEMLNKFINEPKSYEKVFSVKKRELNKKWQAYLRKEYTKK